MEKTQNQITRSSVTASCRVSRAALLLLEALDSFTGKTAWLGFNGELDPIGVKADGKGSDMIVIMPMRV